MSLNTPSPEIEREIQERLKRRFLDRLAQRLKRMRKLLLERNGYELRNECRQLRGSGEVFGFNVITELALIVEKKIPSKEIPRTYFLPEGRQAVETLLATIDDILTENGIYR